MENNASSFGFIVLMAIVVLVLVGGTKNSNSGLLRSNSSTTPQTRATGATSSGTGSNGATTKVIEKIPDNQSPYKGVVKIYSISRSKNPSQEYVTIKMNSSTKESVVVTGWTLRSLNTGNATQIPKATYLYFVGVTNTEENVVMAPGETMYLVTGYSPNGMSFKVNECSGYLAQNQSFVPYLSRNCPLPRNEDLSSIPKLTINDACFDYIETFSQCKIQKDSLPVYWSGECNNFIYNKINYPSCVAVHKDDKDFYGKEWRVYLKRGATLWKDRRESVGLYDNLGKLVDTYSY